MNWFPLFPFAVFFVWLFLFGMRHGKSCPDCGTPLSPFQSPLNKTKRQWIEGGFVCNHCGCESDISGNKVSSETPPLARSLVMGMAFLALAAISAALMLAGVLIR